MRCPMTPVETYLREARASGVVGTSSSPALANLPKHPDSVPINMLVQVESTPLYGKESLDDFDFIRTIAVARIMMPQSYVRLSAGREKMSEQTQALCFFAGANSIFYGEKLLTAGNPCVDEDRELLKDLGLEAQAPYSDQPEPVHSH